jgi:phosphonate transport system substrate-binding protein
VSFAKAGFSKRRSAGFNRSEYETKLMTQISAPDGGTARRKSLFGSFGNIVRWALLLALAVVIAFSIDAIHATITANSSKGAMEESTVRSSGLITPIPRGLASKFTDLQGRLLADPPSDPAQLLNPPTIVVAHLDSSDDSEAISWSEFEKHLATVTGRKVTDMIFDNSPAQLAKINDGSITLVALHAADTPFLVNNYGYQPVAVMGDDSGAVGNHLDIIVPANSTITQNSGLRGHSLTCTVPTSITGYRAAIALLMMPDSSLRPNVDYFVTWSLSQKKSILGIANNEFEAAAISDDKLKTLLAKDDLTTSSYKIIYESDVIPRTTIGYFCNLKPELAAKVKEAILSFKPGAEATVATTNPADNETTDATAKPMHFIPVDYKKDFQLVRRIDDNFDPRLDSKTNNHNKSVSVAQ